MPALMHEARPMDSASPACCSGPMKSRFISWVAASEISAIFTGVRMSWRA